MLTLITRHARIIAVTRLSPKAREALPGLQGSALPSVDSPTTRPCGSARCVLPPFFTQARGVHGPNLTFQPPFAEGTLHIPAFPVLSAEWTPLIPAASATLRVPHHRAFTTLISTIPALSPPSPRFSRAASSLPLAPSPFHPFLPSLPPEQLNS